MLFLGSHGAATLGQGLASTECARVACQQGGCTRVQYAQITADTLVFAAPCPVPQILLVESKSQCNATVPAYEWYVYPIHHSTENSRLQFHCARGYSVWF